MASKFKNRMASEQGFTLIELLVVIVILGILVAIAVPSYLAFRGNAQDAASKSNVRSAIPAAEAWYQDTSGGNSSYTGLTPAKLALEAPGVSADVSDVIVGAKAPKAGQGYCISDDAVAGHEFYYIGGDVAAFTATSSPVVSKITAGKCTDVITTP